MKKLVIILCLMFPVTAIAQDQSKEGMDIQNMMQMMQEMQQCMESIDQAELESIGEQSEKFSGELEALCKNGERKKAQKKAIAYSKKIMESPAFVQMKICGEITKGLMPQGAGPSFGDDFDFSKRHVCDE